MVKPAKKPEKKELPPRYPRSEKILIFGDMGELEYVFELLDELNERLSKLPLDSSDADWADAFSFSGTFALKNALIKACTEFQGFGEAEGWKPEDDPIFMRWMNDPDELRHLVNELENGRIFIVEGKEQIRYEPAYHAAARALQVIMNFHRTPGNAEWIKYCINEIKQYLTRYRAASLEITAHRENVYLHNNQENIRVGEARLRQQRQFSEKGTAEKIKYSDAEKEKWLKAATQIKADNSNISVRKLTNAVIQELNMAFTSFESVRNYLGRIDTFKRKKKAAIK